VDLKNQKRMAAGLLKCGGSRVRINPNRISDVADAITRADIRTAIQSGSIYAVPRKGNSRGRINSNLAQKMKGRQSGRGSKKGTFNTRAPRKQRWKKTIRAMREQLKSYREQGRIDRSTYRKFYRLTKGGMFKGRKNLEEHLRGEGLLKEEMK
jgi:large subunit ribosomal protein L19e